MPTDPQTTGRGPSLAVERWLNTVTLTIQCANEYDAMKLYDEMCEGGRAGYIELELETRESAT